MNLEKNFKNKLIFFLELLIFIGFIVFVFYNYSLINKQAPNKAKKIYWLIPDGLRAEPDQFTVYQWAKEGKLPNIKKMMDNGSYGYSIPSFPSHTPTNFASLLTGSTPDVNGVPDGPMHTEGAPLEKPSVAGFSSVAKKVPPIWKTLEENGKKVTLLSVPGSTPPELEKGITIRGRWGNWGADVHALNFEPKSNFSIRKEIGRGVKLFFLSQELTSYIDIKEAIGWENTPKSYSPAKEVALAGYGSTFYGYIYDSSNDQIINYDRLYISKDKKEKSADIGRDQWSDWVDVNLKVKDMEFPSHARFRLIRLTDDGTFRIRVFYDNLNKFIVKPNDVVEELEKNVGPMMDFSDNFPPQLIYYPEDKKVMLEESQMTYDWHNKAVPFLLQKYNPDVFISDIYTPNQVLTSRWWMGYIDKNSPRYNEVSDSEREKLWEEVKDIYKRMDDMVGEVLKKSDKDTLVVLSSDHGAVPLDKYVKLNNLFAKEGLLKFTINPENGEPVIDWANTKAVYLKMAHIYVNPNGLAGNYKRASGPEYEELRNKVIKILEELKDDNGEKPLEKVFKWEDAEKELKLPKDRIGDLVVANKPGYGWYEEVSSDMSVITKSSVTGYKQAILADNVKGMWTPFVIMGPGVKKGYFIKDPIRDVDQYPTIFKLLDIKIPDFVTGKPVESILVK